MQYAKASLGRVFLLKFSHGDIVLEEIDKFCRGEKLKSATLFFIGALKKGELVTGPKKPAIPPEPNRLKFKDGWEVLGIGTVFTNKSGPQIHIHAAMGKNRKALTGCVRRDSQVFLVIEAVVFELKGLKATKDIDPDTGLNLLRIIS
jgi:predicted DNA-binding protein with PD1-like motif